MGSAKVRRRLRARHPAFAVLAVVCLIVAAVAASSASAKPGGAGATIKVGLITKDVTNPFFVKMKAGATAQAKKLGATLIYAAGKNSSDNASQITAIENMVDRRRQGHPDHRRRRQGRERGDREGAQGGRARDRARLADQPDDGGRRALRDEQLQRRHPDREVRPRRDKGKTVTIAMLDEHAGSSVGDLRHNGFTARASGSRTATSRSCASRNGGRRPRPTRRRPWRTASRRTPTSTSSTRSTSRAPRAPGPR